MWHEQDANKATPPAADPRYQRSAAPKRCNLSDKDNGKELAEPGKPSQQPRSEKPLSGRFGRTLHVPPVSFGPAPGSQPFGKQAPTSGRLSTYAQLPRRPAVRATAAISLQRVYRSAAEAAGASKKGLADTKTTRINGSLDDSLAWPRRNTCEAHRVRLLCYRLLKFKPIFSK